MHAYVHACNSSGPCTSPSAASVRPHIESGHESSAVATGAVVKEPGIWHSAQMSCDAWRTGMSERRRSVSDGSLAPAQRTARTEASERGQLLTWSSRSDVMRWKSPARPNPLSNSSPKSLHRARPACCGGSSCSHRWAIELQYIEQFRIPPSIF